MNSTNYNFDTPFADAVIKKEDEHSGGNYQNNFSFDEFSSPFKTTFESVSESQHSSPIAEEYINLLAELEDNEFKEALHDIANEMAESWRSRVSDEVAMGIQFQPFAMSQAQQYYSPMLNESNRLFDAASHHFSGSDMAAHSEASVDLFFETLEINNDGLSPIQEQFIRKLANKAQSLVKKGVQLAKKGISAVSKFLPINVILDKLKGLVKPLLEKVLKSLIKKLPSTLQPHATTLASKFLNLETIDSNTTQSTELETLEMEFDNTAAQILFTPEDHEANYVAAQYESSFENLERIESYESSFPFGQSIDEARENFIQELKNLKFDEDPTPAIERFLPAAIMALKPVIKMGIGLIGRQKIINFLANLISNLIKKYVPADVTQPLAASIIDLGMSAIGFELNDVNNVNLGYEAIANTIEETIEGLNEMENERMKDPDELTMHVLDKFEKAAANNFPPNYIKSNLRNTKQRATFVNMPRVSTSKLYKKFTQVYDVIIDSKNGASVKIFRSVPLANFLKDKYGLEIGNGIKAKAHVYELKNRGKLSDINKFENLPGLNKQSVRSWIQLLPLTKEAANTLLNEPNLGINFSEKSLSSRYNAKPGQRFYFLEIEGARLRVPQTDSKNLKSKNPSPTYAESRSADVQAVLNFSKSEIKLNYYFSEEDAKTVVEKINRNDAMGVATNIKNSFQVVFKDILSNHISSKVKIIHEAMPEMYLEAEDIHEHFSLSDIGSAIRKTAGDGALKKIVETLTNAISSKAYDSVLQFLKTRSKEFITAQSEPQDGVTICVVWKNVQGMSMIKSLISAIKGGGLPYLSDLTMPKLNAPELVIKGGKKFD